MIWSILAFIGCCVLGYILRGLSELREKTEKVEKYVTKYPTKWDWKLEELGIKEEWDREREKFLKPEVFDVYKGCVLQEEGSFAQFVISSFSWSGTEKGFEYWYEISRK